MRPSANFGTVAYSQTVKNYSANMHPQTRMRYSRNDWKAKAVDRAKELKACRRTKIRHKDKIERLEEENQQLREENTAFIESSKKNST